jgi:NAD(P)-dependent dehydrogenase (short-subunit alcohol dehydrogenase family)
VSDPFRERVAVVTGAASGIGLAMARAFASRGLGRAEQEIAEAGAPALAVPTDVTRRESVDALADAAFRRFGAAHIVCNNAGIATAGSMVGADPKEWDAAMAVNLWGVVHGVDAFVPRMVEQKQGGNIVNTASMSGLVGMQYLGVYCVTKFAVVGLTESLERELRPHGIGVHVLCPMLVDTPIAENSARVLGRPAPSSASDTETDSGAPPPGALQGGVIRPEQVAERVVRGVERGSLYILTHPEQRKILRRRWERQDAVFAQDF